MEPRVLLFPVAPRHDAATAALALRDTPRAALLPAPAAEPPVALVTTDPAVLQAAYPRRSAAAARALALHRAARALVRPPEPPQKAEEAPPAARAAWTAALRYLAGAPAVAADVAATCHALRADPAPAARDAVRACINKHSYNA